LAPIRINFSTETLGCLTILLAVLAPLVLLLFGLTDLSDNTARGAAFWRMFQSWRIGEVPVVAALVAGFILFEAAMNGWRWADRTAITMTSDALLLHPSVLRKSISLQELTEVKTVKRGTYGIKTINQSLRVSWIDEYRRSTKSRTIRNIDLASASGQLFKERLGALGKWRESD
jgi:hypothetical protein